MKKFLTICIVLALSLVSCVKEALPECPYQYSIQISVKDKNYDNSAALGMEIVDENQPFREYISNIYYALQSVNTGEDIIAMVEKSIVGDEKEVELVIDHIPDGKYLLTVWGNAGSTGGTAGDPSLLHKNKEEDTDLYIVSDTLDIKTGIAKTKSLELKRAKGKLVVTFENLPFNIERINEVIASVYRRVDRRGIYSEKDDVEKIFTKSDRPIERITTFSAPSAEGERSTLYLSAYKGNSNDPAVEITPIEIDITRNEITAVTINYNSSQTQLEIWVFIDNEWALIRTLDIIRG